MNLKRGCLLVTSDVPLVDALVERIASVFKRGVTGCRFQWRVVDGYRWGALGGSGQLMY